MLATKTNSIQIKCILLSCPKPQKSFISTASVHWAVFYFFILDGLKDLCSPSSLAPKHVWFVMLLFKSSTGLLFFGRRHIARVQLAWLPQLAC